MRLDIVAVSLGLLVTCAVILPQNSVVGTSPAFADDGDGDGDGGGSGSGSGGGGAGGGDGGGGSDLNASFFSDRAYRKRRRYRNKRRTRRPRLSRQRARSSSRTARSVEIVAIQFDDEDLRQLRERGFRVIGDRLSTIMGGRLTRLEGPRGISLRRAIRLAKRVNPAATVVQNDRFRKPRRDRFKTAGSSCGADCPRFEVTKWSTSIAKCSVSARLGIIDTLVDTSHPTLKSAKISIVQTVRQDKPQSNDPHGTAVASLLVGATGSAVPGMVPGAELISVNAFHATPRGSQADTFDLIWAIDALVSQRVRVINMSLTGPDNPLLRQAVATAREQGTSIVAAVGEPRRQSGYPAKYEGVIAVSSVNARLRSARHSARGVHVDFSAPGVGLIAAGQNGELRTVEGSSFATPFVSAAYAIGLPRLGVAKTEQLLREAAVDLGPRGRDTTYGWGLLQYEPLKGCGN